MFPSSRSGRIRQTKEVCGMLMGFRYQEKRTRIANPKTNEKNEYDNQVPVYGSACGFLHSDCSGSLG